MMVRHMTEHQRMPWEDRFQVPTLRELRAGLPQSATPLFDDLASELNGIWSSDAQVAWQGDCWKWTLTFADRKGRLPVAVIIPNPNDFQIALKLDRSFVRDVRNRRFKRAVRDGLEMADEPFDTDWGVWTISSKSMLEEVLTLTRLSVAHLNS